MTDMKISDTGEYALRTLVRLGVAQRLGRETVSLAALAQSENLDESTLAPILQSLSGGGYVRETRGRDGGFRLAKTPEQIRVGDVVRQVDGDWTPFRCASEAVHEPCTCPDEQHCGLRMLMVDVRNAISGLLDKYTLADVVDVTLRKTIREALELAANAAPTPHPKKAARKKAKSALRPASGSILRGLLGEGGGEH